MKQIIYYPLLLLFLVNYSTSFSQNDIEIENTFQNETIELKGTGPNNHGQINVRRSNENNGVIIDGGEGIEGGQINLYHSNSNSTIQLDAEGVSNAGGGPFLYMQNIDGQFGAFLSAQEEATGGASLKLYNFAGTRTLELDAQNGESTQGGSFMQLLDPNGLLMVNLLAKSTDNRGAEMEFYNSEGTTTIILDTQETDNTGAALKLYNYAGDETIELDAGFNGKGRILTQELQITGGSDFAEYFCVTNKELTQKGMVLSIDEESSGKLKLSNRKYDQGVVGVISGANGIDTGLVMSDDGTIADGEFPVALSGRVYVKTNQEGGEIKIGDFLTTSSEAGIAMRVKNKRKAYGAIIGKAMTAADENGFVLVLVNLQ